MRVEVIGNSSFNADVLEGLTQDELFKMFPNISKDIVKELGKQMKAPKKARVAEKVEKPKKDRPTD